MKQQRLNAWRWIDPVELTRRINGIIDNQPREVREDDGPEFNTLSHRIDRASARHEDVEKPEIASATNELEITPTRQLVEEGLLPKGWEGT